MRLLLCEEKDPSWMTNRLKLFRKKITIFFEVSQEEFSAQASQKTFDLQIKQQLKLQQLYIKKKLCDSLVNPECYWKLLKRLLNEKKIHVFRQFSMKINL